MDIFWICFASDVLWWWLEILLLPSIREIVMKSIFFWGSLSCLQEGDFILGIFVRGPQLAWTGFVCDRGFSLVSLWSMIASCYFFVDLVFLSWYNKSDIVDVCLCKREGAMVTWSTVLVLELTHIFQNWSGWRGSSSTRHLQTFPGKSLLFQI